MMILHKQFEIEIIIIEMDCLSITLKNAKNLKKVIIDINSKMRIK
jgi:hypothetical protein